MTITMYDSVNADAIPIEAKAVAGYIDGNFLSFAGLVRRFYPHAHCLSIGGMIGNLAEISDVESGNPINTPALVRADFERKYAHHVWKPGYYADMEDMQNIVIPGLIGISRSHYRLWLAEWDNDPTIPEWADAKQYRGGNIAPYDLSAVRDDFFQTRHPEPPRPRPRRPHPKVTAGALAGGMATAVLAVLNSHGVHVARLTAPEMSAIGVAASALAAYVRRG